MPGYVARLEDDLEKVFGEYTVFRDVEDIAGGTEWKKAIDYNLKSSAALILVIGQHWSRIWQERQHEPVNHVALELQRARELGVPVIPVTINGSMLAADIELGDIAWLHDQQMYDISDRQGRWRYDMRGLVALLERQPGLERQDEPDQPVKPLPVKSSKTWLWLVIAGLILGVVVTGLISENQTPDQVAQGTELVVSRHVESTPATKQETVAVTRTAMVDAAPPMAELAGTWVSDNDGTQYIVDPLDHRRFRISSPGYASGVGEFIAGMPRKFSVTMEGAGYGEYSLSASNDRAMGWFEESETGDKVYETLRRSP